jgi:MFS family permease
VANPVQFLYTASARERRALIASALGWMLDGMDVTLYAMIIRELLRELRLSSAQAGLLASLTLIASGVGGILFGILADRAGRRLALMTSIGVYSLFTAACGLAQGVAELAVFRFLVGLGMGGQWAAGAALVSETWRREHRGKALGLMQSGFAVGYALAAWIAAAVMPRWGWRAVFFVGIFPALLTLWIRRGVEESPLWLAQKSGFGVRGSGLRPPKGCRGARAQASPRPGPASAPATPRFGPQAGVGKEESLSRTPHPAARIPGPAGEARRRPFDSTLRTHTKLLLLTLLMNSAALFAWWGLFTWIPTYLAQPASQGGRGLSLLASSEWIAAMQLGMWLGYVTFGYVSDAVGRKKTYIAYLFLAALLVPPYSWASPRTLLVVGPLLAFFGTGHFTGFGIITAELFPTAFRATAMGLTYNFGRALSAAAPWAIGALAEHAGLGSAFWISGLAFLAAGLLALGLPETRGRSLS